MPYKIVSRLGEGSFGVVYHFRHSNNNEYALKVIKLIGVTFDDVKVEGSTIMQLSHPHIIQCCNCSQIDTERACLLMEFCGRGNLSMEIQRVVIDESRAIRWFAQMADAVKYLHSQHVMHRDLKPDNILLTSDDLIKIGDLGIAKILEFTAQHAMSQSGTPCYMSPQALNGEPYNNKTPALPNSISEKMKTLIMNVLERVEQKRPTAQDIFDTLNQSFMNGKYSTIGQRILEKVSLDMTELRNALKN